MNIIKQDILIDMNRGWPCKEQLDLSMPLLDCVNSEEIIDVKNDYRSYAGTGGIPSAKKLFAELLNIQENEIYIGGTMSTTIMFDILNEFMFFGWDNTKEPWALSRPVKFICPTPGYEKHFLLCKRFGIEMISVPILQDGPDIDLIEKLVKTDKNIRGIWCVPKYSNPTGTIYSAEIIKRLVALCINNKNFYIFWDNAYCVHHLTNQKIRILNILELAKKNGVDNNIFIFSSTSKITFPGGGLAFLGSGESNIDYYTKRKLLSLKTGDKLNQLRHVRFLKDVENIDLHMEKHKKIIGPKFDLVHNILSQRLLNYEQINWNRPLGGYFILLQLVPGTAHSVYESCLEKGILFTRPDSIFPYRFDSEDKYIRLAPTHPSLDELEYAINILSSIILSKAKF